MASIKSLEHPFKSHFVRHRVAVWLLSHILTRRDIPSSSQTSIANYLKGAFPMPFEVESELGKILDYLGQGRSIIDLAVDPTLLDSSENCNTDSRGN